MLSRFHLIPERNGQTDGRTDLLYQYRASVCWRAIKTCIGYDTKAAARRSQNCIRKTKKIRRWTIFSMAFTILTRSQQFACYSESSSQISSKSSHSRRSNDVIYHFKMYTSCGFIFNVVTFFQSSKSIYIPNFIIDITWIHRWDITTSVWKTNVCHIGILFPVVSSTTSQ